MPDILMSISMLLERRDLEKREDRLWAFALNRGEGVA
jgi:hypothetical protein